MCVNVCVPVFCSRAVEQFINKFPQHICIKKDDGYTPLHLAALNDHLDVVTALVEQVSYAGQLTINNSSYTTFCVELASLYCNSERVTIACQEM